MGGRLLYNLFYSTSEPVWEAFASFYGRGSGFNAPPNSQRPIAGETLGVYHQHNGWVVVDLGVGWEWDVRRNAQTFVSNFLGCAGFLIFVYDGDYWGYEFFDNGAVLDHFVQRPAAEPVGFPGEDCRGNPHVVARHLPFLRAEDVAPYLIHQEWEGASAPADLDVPARPGDQFSRLDARAVFDFMRMLGVGIETRDGTWRLKSPEFRTLE